MKKIKSLITLSAVLGVIGLCGQAKPVELEGIDDGSTDTYIVLVDGESGSASANKKTQEVINQIGYLFDEEDYEIKAVYDTLLSGFAITTTSTVAEAIRGLTYVSECKIEQIYAAPEDVDYSSTMDDSSDYNPYLEQKLGNYSKETIHATDSEITAVTGNTPEGGSGIKIGILDTGLFMNQVAGTTDRNRISSYEYVTDPAFVELSSDDAMTSEEQTAWASLIASKTPGQYINNKIIYAYDYNGKDQNVVPSDSDGEHGTHVASLAAANGNSFQGIAPNAQLAILKVFPDDASGAYSSDIISALEDSAELGLDVINLSLGTDLQDDSEDASDAVYAALQNCEKAGVIVNYAAGNSGKSSYTSGNTYYDWTVDTAETSIIGASSTLDEVTNVVASTNPDTAFYDEVMLVQPNGSENQSAVSYSDQVINNSNSSYDPELPMTSLLESDANTNNGTFDYVYIPGYGDEADYANYDVEGKIVVVDRGSLTFWSKTLQATSQGAIALIIVNNIDGNTFNFTFDFSDNQPEIPVCWVFKSTGSYFGTYGSTGTISIVQNEVQPASDGGSYSSFSSDGPGANLDLIPTVAAPGNSVIGAISATVLGETSAVYGYDNLSGTSMATPNFTGAIASLLSEAKATMNDTDYAEYKSTVSMVAMSTADPIQDASKENIGSPRIQGAGQVNVADALSSDGSYIYTSGYDYEFETTRKQAKAELKNVGELYTDLSQEDEAYIEFTYNVVNNSDTARTYDANLSLLIPQLEVGTTTEDYQSDVENGSADEIPTALIDAVTVSVKDDEVTIPDDRQPGTITVAANSTQSGTVKLRIDDLTVTKDFEDEEYGVSNFNGTLREYFNQYFNQDEGAGGSYVEGYLTLSDTDTSNPSTDLSIPYMGFYGDYTKGEAVEPFDFEKTDGHLYTSDMVDKYVQYLTSSYALPNAYSSSTLTASGASLASSTIGNIAGLEASARAGTGSFTTVEGDDDRLYAGAEGVTDHLHAFFFVNRSISASGWSLADSDGNVVSSGNIGCYCATYGLVASDGTLYKSWIHSGTTTYDIYRGYAGIDLSGVNEGEYTISFWFTLRGNDQTVSSGTNTTQTNSYTLVVDRTPPEIVSLNVSTVDGRSVLTAITKGGNEVTSYLQSGSSYYVTENADGTYTTEISLLSSYDYHTFQFADFAHNYTYVTIHSDDLSVYMTANEDGLQRRSDFSWEKLSSGLYEFCYYYNNNTTASPVDLTVYAYAGLDFDDSLLEVYVAGTLTNASYDATTGYVSFVIPAGSEIVSVDLGFDPIALPTATEDDNAGDDDTEDDNAGDDDTEETESSEGLSGGAIAGIVVGSVAGAGVIAAGTVLLIKRRKK